MILPSKRCLLSLSHYSTVPNIPLRSSKPVPLSKQVPGPLLSWYVHVIRSTQSVQSDCIFSDDLNKAIILALVKQYGAGRRNFVKLLEKLEAYRLSLYL